MARTVMLGTADPDSPLRYLARNREGLVLIFDKVWGDEARQIKDICVEASDGDKAKIELALWYGKQNLVNQKDWNGSSPLHFAARDADSTLVQLLLQRGAQVNTPDKAGWTPLHESAANGRLRSMQLLLAASADVNAADKTKTTPLHCVALHSNHPESAQLLLHHGANVNAKDNNGRTPLKLATFTAYWHQEAATVIQSAGGKSSK